MEDVKRKNVICKKTKLSRNYFWKQTKQNYQLCKKRICTATHVMKHIWTLFLRLETLKYVVGILIQYLLDRDTFNQYVYNALYLQCCSVQCIINCYKFKSKHWQLELILENKKKSSNRKNKKKIINYARKRTCTATYVMKHSWTYVLRFKSLKL